MSHYAWCGALTAPLRQGIIRRHGEEKMTDPLGLSRRQALRYGGLAAAAPLLPAAGLTAGTRNRPGSPRGHGNQGSGQVEYAAIMLPEDGQTWWWYYGVTGEQVGQFLTQNNAMLTDIDAYIDSDNSVKFIVTMAPATGTWWWWWGQTEAQIIDLMYQNHARMTTISPYTDPSDNTLRFAVIMTPFTGAALEWWTMGETGSSLGSELQKFNLMPTQISAYTDVDGSVKLAALGQPAQGTWWWWWGQTGPQVGQLLSQNNAMLTDISPYIDVDGTLKFVTIMAPAQGGWWWWWGQSGDQLGQLLTQNNARLISASGYLA